MTDQNTIFDAYAKQLSVRGTDSIAYDKMIKASFEKARDCGFPSARNEHWRYSDFSALKKKPYKLAAHALHDTINVGQAPSITESPAAKLVFIGGHYSEHLSDLSELVQVASVSHLTNFLMANVEDRLHQLVTGDDTIGLMNTALARSGFVITLPAGIEVEDPIEIIHLSGSSDTQANMTRLILNIGEGAKATVIERFVGDTQDYWTNSVMQIRLSEKASLQHYKLQEESLNATHTSKVHLQVDAESHYQGFNLQTGAKFGRMEHHVAVMGEKADVRIDGANLAAAGQTLDTRTCVDHKVGHATSDQIFRAVLAKQGKSAFQGKVIVADGAQKTLADQSCRALLLDRTAEANAKPELEIYADDVKCSHGATVGELDKKAYFYLISRGIDPTTARQMLVEAFAADTLEFVENQAMADLINARIIDWMSERRET